MELENNNTIDILKLFYQKWEDNSYDLSASALTTNSVQELTKIPKFSCTVSIFELLEKNVLEKTENKDCFRLTPFGIKIGTKLVSGGEGIKINSPNERALKIAEMKATHDWAGSWNYADPGRTRMQPMASYCKKCRMTIFAFKANPSGCPKNAG